MRPLWLSLGLWLAACSSDPERLPGPADGSGNVDPVGSSSSGNGDGKGGAGGRDPGGYGSNSATGGTFGSGLTTPCAPATTAGQGGACAATSSEAEPAPLSLYLMIDRSGSMNDLTGTGLSKWEALRGALDDVLSSPPLKSLSVAVEFFPPFSGNACDVDTYTSPQVNLTSSGTARLAVLNAMATLPDGSTPTGPALAGALSEARSWAKKQPDDAYAVLLATDGTPTDCAPTDSLSLAALTASALTSSTKQPGVPTFVIGLLGVNDLGTGARDALDAIARAGGTSSALIVNPAHDASADLSEALREVATRGVSCSLSLPAEVDDASELSLVNVALTTASCGRRVLTYVDSAADCKNDGWHYDVDLASGTRPKRAVLCPDSCERYRAGARATIEVGCQTQGWVN